MTPCPRYVFLTCLPTLLLPSKHKTPIPSNLTLPTRLQADQSAPQLEDALGVSFAEKLLGLSQEEAEPGLLQAVGQAVGMLLEGLGVDEVNTFLDATTGGLVSSLSEALGVDDIEAALGIAPAPNASASA